MDSKESIDPSLTEIVDPTIELKTVSLGNVASPYVLIF